MIYSSQELEHLSFLYTFYFTPGTTGETFSGRKSSIARTVKASDFKEPR